MNTDKKPEKLRKPKRVTKEARVFRPKKVVLVGPDGIVVRRR